MQLKLVKRVENTTEYLFFFSEYLPLSVRRKPNNTVCSSVYVHLLYTLLQVLHRLFALGS